jgi:hypothetical protein
MGQAGQWWHFAGLHARQRARRYIRGGSKKAASLGKEKKISGHAGVKGRIKLFSGALAGAFLKPREGDCQTKQGCFVTAHL